MLTTCGVLVTDGVRLLLGQATGTTRWDIPKGVAEDGEPWPVAAVRELAEETGLAVAPADLADLGVHRYRPGKQLALFRWQLDVMPDPAALRCTSYFTSRNGRQLPELCRFALVPIADAPELVGKDMGRVLRGLGGVPERGKGQLIGPPS